MSSPFTRRVLRALSFSGWLRRQYLARERVANYAFACGVIGVLVNYVVYHVTVGFTWEPVAFYSGVLAGACSNYLFTVGRYRWVFGFEETKR